MNLLWKMLCNQMGFLSLEGDGGAGGGAGAGAGEDGASGEGGEAGAGGAPDIAAIVTKALEPVVAKIASLEAKAGAPAPAAEANTDLDKEINLRRDQLSAIRAGTLDAKYEGEVLSKLSEAQARKVGTEMVGRENAKSQYLNQWNFFLGEAYKEFPELKDPNSELFKEAKAIVESDPGYRSYVKVAQDKGDGKIDFASLDPRVNLRAAREAFAIVEKRNAGKPRTPTNRNKAGLEGGSGSAPAPASNDQLAKLEEKAINTGNPNDWTAYIRERDRALKSRQAMTA